VVVKGEKGSCEGGIIKGEVKETPWLLAMRYKQFTELRKKDRTYANL
jgi:hypothetical protein